MDEDQMRFHRALRKELSKESHPINLGKIFTLVLVFLLLVGGTIAFFRSNATISAAVVQEVKDTNACSLETGDKMIYIKDSLSCSYVGSDDNTLIIKIDNHSYPNEKNVRIKKIAVNSCSVIFDKVINNKASEQFELECPSGLSNSLNVEYTDMESGLSHSLSGKINIIQRA